MTLNMKRIIVLISFLTTMHLHAMQSIQQPQSFEDLKKVLENAPAEIADKIIRQYFKDLLASSINMKDLQKKVIDFSRQGSFFYGIANSKEGQQIVSYAAQSICKRLINNIQQTFDNMKKEKLKNPNYQPAWIENLYPNLTKNGINAVNKDGGNALHILLQYPKISLVVIENLIACGIDVNKQDNDGETPLLSAAFQYNIPAMQLLIQNGAQIEMPGEMIIYDLIKWYKYKDANWREEHDADLYKTLEFLLKNGAKVNYYKIFKVANNPETSRWLSDLIYSYAGQSGIPYLQERSNEQPYKYTQEQPGKRRKTE